MKNLCLLVFAVCISSAIAAQNLVNNGDFSIKASGSGCLTGGTGFDKGRPDSWWDETTKPNFMENGETPDYFHPCAPVGTFNPGNNGLGCTDPKAGTAYVGLLAWNNNHPDFSSEYMYHELSSPLVVNQPYYIEFWVSAADNSNYNYFVASLGMYLTNDTNDFASIITRGYHNLASSVQIPNTFPATNYYTTTNGWQKISGTYTPTVTGVKHLLIGNFDPGVSAYDPVTNPNSPNIQHRPGADNGSLQVSYYFIDAVTVIPVGQEQPNYEPEINGPNAICQSGSTVTLSNFPTASTVTWSASPTNLITPNSGTGATANVSAINHSVAGEVTITFQASGTCDQLTKSENFTVGHPSQVTGDMSGPTSVSISEVAWYSVPSQSQADGQFYWSLPSGFSVTSQGNGYHQVQVWIQNGASNGYVQIWKTNECGNGGAKFKYVTVDSGGGGGGTCRKCIIQSIITPNPVVGNELDIKYADKETSELLSYEDFDLPVEYVITDQNGNIVFIKSSKKTRDKLNLSSIREDGTYILSIYYGDGSGVEQIRLIIER